MWGPYTDPLSANTYRLTVTAPGAARLQLEARRQGEDGRRQRLRHHPLRARTPAPSTRRETRWKGSAAATSSSTGTRPTRCPQHDTNVGQMAFTYSRMSPTATVTNNVTFTNIFDNCNPASCNTHGQIFDALYAYSATPGCGGDLQYGATENFVATTTANETLSLHSRWMETGAGRTDVQVTGGDVGTAVDTSSECWDSNFLSVYSAASYDPNDPASTGGRSRAARSRARRSSRCRRNEATFEGPGPRRRLRAFAMSPTGVGASEWRKAGRFSGGAARALRQVRRNRVRPLPVHLEGSPPRRRTPCRTCSPRRSPTGATFATRRRR